MHRSRAPLLICPAIVLLLALLAPGLHAAFIIDYRDTAGSGFHDTTYGDARRSAFEWAVGEWDAWMSGFNAVPIRVSAGWDTLDGSRLGRVFPYSTLYHNHPSFPLQDTWYGNTLANYFAGEDLSGGSWHIHLTFNSNLTGWNYDYNLAGGSFPGQYDFATVSLHEIGHGMGFFHSFDSTGSWGYYGDPVIYDRLLEYGDGTSLISANPAPGGVTSTIYWGGGNATAANGGERVQVYAPSTWSNGSSLSHIDPGTHPGLLMNPSIATNVARREIDPLMEGMLFDMGWGLQQLGEVPEPGTVALMAVGLGALVMAARRRRRRG